MNKAVERLNKQYSQVKIGGKVRYWDGEDFLRQQDFIALEAGNGEWVTNSKGKKLIPDTTVWLSSKDRNLYRRATFYPGEVPGDTFNLWQGWGVGSKQEGHYRLFRQHLMNNVCNGNNDHARWIWQWLAQLVRQPEEKTGVALVLVGDHGVGKSIFGEVIAQLCKRNSITLSNSDSVTSKFNSRYERCLLCVVDEAVWAGDKKGESVIKNLITAPSLSVERKGLEPYDAPNYTRFIFTSNGPWVVNNDQDERRYMTVRVGTGWINDRETVGAMFKELGAGGYSRLLYDLLHTEPDPRINLSVPLQTEAGQEQKDLSEPAYVSFWREYIEDQELDWNKTAWLDDIEPAMIEYCQVHSYSKPLERRFYIPQLKKLGILSESKRARDPSTRRRGTLLTFNVGRRTKSGQLKP